MLPALRPGQDVLVFIWAYLFFKPKVGDMVIIKRNDREIIKRIQKCDDRQYFVQGDNAEESTDSRDFGPIDQSAIIGKVVLVVR